MKGKLKNLRMKIDGREIDPKTFSTLITDEEIIHEVWNLIQEDLIELRKTLKEVESRVSLLSKQVPIIETDINKFKQSVLYKVWKWFKNLIGKEVK